jgi:hypothetical protein
MIVMKKLIVVFLGWMIWCDGSNGSFSEKPDFYEDKQKAVKALSDAWRPEWVSWQKNNQKARAGCDFYEVTKIEYTVEVKKETIKKIKETEETVELGREVKFK